MIDLQNVSKAYAAGTPAVNNMNIHIDKGEFVFIVGDSDIVIYKKEMKEKCWCQQSQVFNYENENCDYCSNH